MVILGEHIYLVGGEDASGKLSNVIYKAPLADPAKLEKAVELKAARSGAMAYVVNSLFVVLGGCQPGLIEVFNTTTWKPEPGIEPKSKNFYAQLECYTGDTKLEGFTLS